MKVFVSYAYTGEDADVLGQRLSRLRDTFAELGVDYYIKMFSPEWQGMMDREATGGEFLNFALKSMRDCDVVLVLNTSERRSEGMLMEVGAAVTMRKPIVLAQHQSSVGKTYLPTVVDESIVWRKEGELVDSIKNWITKRITRSIVEEN